MLFLPWYTATAVWHYLFLVPDYARDMISVGVLWPDTLGIRGKGT
jgi:hypothetical protein